MRVLFTTQPADGHLNPMLGLSAALREAGHEVRFATSAAFVPRIEARGERAVAVGRSWLSSTGASEPPPPDPTAPGAPTAFQRLFLRGAAAEMAADLVALIDDLEPDVLVRESVEFAGAAAAERCELPWATFDFAFPFGREAMVRLEQIVEDDPELDRLRDAVGLPPTDDPDWFIGDLQIGTLPAAYRAGWPTREPHLVVRPNALDIVDDAPVPAWIEELRDAVYVSFGTIFASMFPDALAAAARGAAALGCPTVVTHGPVLDAAELDLPDQDHLRVAAYVPQGPVLDRVQAAVTHGGTGTTMGALARGIPVVVVPIDADQAAHAGAVERTGSGIVLDHASLTPDQVTDALRTVLTDPSYRAAARDLADAFAALPHPSTAIPALAALTR